VPCSSHSQISVDTVHALQDMLSTGTQSDLLAAGQLLKQYNGSLQSQLSRHQHAAHILQALLAKQVRSVASAYQQSAYLSILLLPACDRLYTNCFVSMRSSASHVKSAYWSKHLCIALYQLPVVTRGHKPISMPLVTASNQHEQHSDHTGCQKPLSA